MTSIPAPDLNNLKFSNASVAEPFRCLRGRPESLDRVAVFLRQFFDGSKRKAFASSRLALYPEHPIMRQHSFAKDALLVGVQVREAFKVSIANRSCHIVLV